MKSICAVIFLFLIASFSVALGVDSASVNELSEKAKSLSLQCNLEARNSLISGDIQLVEQLCLDAVKEIEKSSSDKELTINSLLNLAYTYTLAGLFDKATPLYEKAKGIGEKVYKPESMELRKINEVINSHEDIVRMQKNK